MQQHSYEIVNSRGLHARASALFVKTATTFTSEIHLGLDDLQVNGKSIMGVMTLAAHKGCVITLTANGSDEVTAVQAIGQLIRDGFGEH